MKEMEANEEKKVLVHHENFYQKSKFSESFT
jgi:hypothetical protein